MSCFLYGFHLFLLLTHGASKCDWPIIDGVKLTFDDFFERYWEEQPVLFTNMLNTWPAVLDDRWRKDKFVARYGHHNFTSADVSGNNRKGVLGAKYVDGLSIKAFWNSSEKTAASWFLKPTHPLVRELLHTGDFSIPEGLKGIHRDGPFLSLGRKAQWNPFHRHEHNWFALVHGAKRWYALAPEETESIGYDLQAVNVCSDKRLRSFSRCDTKAGQVVYLPTNFEHGTCVLQEDTIGVAFIGSSDTAAVKVGVRSGADVSLDVKLGRASANDLKSVLKAQPSARDDLLSLAAETGHTDMVKLLYKPRIKSETKTNVMSLAVKYGHVNVLEYLGSNKRIGLNLDTGSIPLMHAAALEGHVPVVRWLEKRAAEGEWHFEPIHAAASGGHIPVLQHLLTRRVQLHTEDAGGMTALHLAAMFDNYYVIRFLNEDKGVDLKKLLTWAKTENHVSAGKWISKQIAKAKGEKRNAEL